MNKNVIEKERLILIQHMVEINNTTCHYRLCFEVLTLVLAAGRPNSYFLFLRIGARLPPVALRLCQ